MLGLSLRFSIRSYLTSSRTYLPTYCSVFRTLSTTPKRLTTKVPDRDSFIDSIKHTALFQKIADKPNAVKAFYDLHTLIKEMGALFLSFSSSLCLTACWGTGTRYVLQGLDKPSSAPPSVYQGFKLVTNRRFAKAAKRVMEELKEAGVKLNSEVLICCLCLRWSGLSFL
jgi:hypothetical protein